MNSPDMRRVGEAGASHDGAKGALLRRVLWFKFVLSPFEGISVNENLPPNVIQS